MTLEEKYNMQKNYWTARAGKSTSSTVREHKEESKLFGVTRTLEVFTACRGESAHLFVVYREGTGTLRVRKSLRRLYYVNGNRVRNSEGLACLKDMV